MALPLLAVGGVVDLALGCVVRSRSFPSASRALAMGPSSPLVPRRMSTVSSLYVVAISVIVMMPSPMEMVIRMPSAMMGLIGLSKQAAEERLALAMTVCYSLAWTGSCCLSYSFATPPSMHARRLHVGRPDVRAGESLLIVVVSAPALPAVRVRNFIATGANKLRWGSAAHTTSRFGVNGWGISIMRPVVNDPMTTIIITRPVST